jgi:hypothetical protein
VEKASEELFPWNYTPAAISRKSSVPVLKPNVLQKERVVIVVFVVL